MKNALLGMIGGLLVGLLSAVVYGYYMGNQFAHLKAQLNEANLRSAQIDRDRLQLSSEASSVSDQINQLQASNTSLREQLGEDKKAKNASTVPSLNSLALANALRNATQSQQQLFLLQNRLNLTPDQQNALKDAMAADARQRMELTQKLMYGGKIDPSILLKQSSFQQTLDSVLTPDQRTAYQELQTEVQSSHADTLATSQMNQLAPLLQLSDSQKDQMVQALYQVQMSAPSAASLATNSDVSAAMSAQAQAIQAAIGKVLNPQQLALYQQQIQIYQQQQQQALMQIKATGTGAVGNASQ